MLEKIAIGLLGVLVGAFIGHRFAWGRDRAKEKETRQRQKEDRQRTFRAFVQQLSAAE